MNTIKIISYLLLVLSLNDFSFSNDNPKSVIGNTVTDFTLKNTDSQDISLSDFPDVKGFVIVFTCNHCPFAKLYPQRLNELNTKYQALDIPLLAVNSMDTLMYEEEGFEIMQTKSASESFNFPYLQDGSQIVGKDFGAALTPHAYIIWKENDNWVIKYSGAIDDNGQHPELATPFIANALDELLQSKPVSKSETQSIGCKIYFRK